MCQTGSRCEPVGHIGPKWYKQATSRRICRRGVRSENPSPPVPLMSCSVAPRAPVLALRAIREVTRLYGFYFSLVCFSRSINFFSYSESRVSFPSAEPVLFALAPTTLAFSPCLARIAAAFVSSSRRSTPRLTSSSPPKWESGRFHSLAAIIRARVGRLRPWSRFQSTSPTPMVAREIGGRVCERTAAGSA